MVFWHFVSELLWIACYCFDIFSCCRCCCVSWEPGKLPRNETCCWWFPLSKQVAEVIVLVPPVLALVLKILFENLLSHFFFCFKCQVAGKHNCRLLFFGYLVISNNQPCHDIFIFTALQKCSIMFCADLHLCQLQHCLNCLWEPISSVFGLTHHWSVPAALSIMYPNLPSHPAQETLNWRKNLEP